MQGESLAPRGGLFGTSEAQLWRVRQTQFLSFGLGLG